MLNLKGIQARQQAKEEIRLSKQLWYKVKKKKDKIPKLLYYPLIFITYLLHALYVLWKSIKYLILFAIILGLLITIYLGFLIYPTFDDYNKFAKEVVMQSTLDDFSINEGSVIYDVNGEVLANLYNTSFNTYLTYDEIPKYVRDAFIAVEDRTFWENKGFDLYGIARVVVDYAKSHGDDVHGASTITQQLARTTYLTREVSLERKGKEILISYYMNKKYTKQQIMEFYVNTCCFSNGIYGIQGAAKTYFNKTVDKLSLAQVAFLCAIPNRPSYFNPLKDITRITPRQQKILGDMLECGYISQSEYRNAMQEEIVIERPSFVFNDTLTTYAVDCATRYLMTLNGFEFHYKFANMDDYTAYHDLYNEKYNEYKKLLYTKGYKIYTSLDKQAFNDLQAILDDKLSFNLDIDEETGNYALQGALTVIDNNTHKVVALVGGRSIENEEMKYSFNRAYQSYRQPGSSIKPIAVYAPALMRGYTPETTVFNISVKQAKEKGVDPQLLTGAAMPLRTAVEQSKNGVAWQVFDRLTPNVGLSYLTQMKFSNLCPNDYFNSSSLGGLTYGVNTVEMASAYETLANHGYYNEPTCIVKFLDKDDVDIYQEAEQYSIYTSKAADQMVDICKGVLTRGTASKLKWSKATKMDAFAKTGTTNENKDAWLCGATPYYTISVWVGFDQPKEMKNLWGSSYPATIWKDCMLYLIQDKEIAEFVEYTGSLGFIANEDLTDNEIVIGYTDSDYNNDQIIVDQLNTLMQEIKNLDKHDKAFNSTLDKLFYQGMYLTDTLYSQKTATEYSVKIQSLYESLGGKKTYTHNSQAITEFTIEDEQYNEEAVDLDELNENGEVEE